MDLSQLILWRNDPKAAADILEEALKGNLDAQYAAGLIYAEGRGVPIDLVQSFYWLTQGVERGDAEAERLRNIVGTQMSEEEYQRACHLLKVARSANQMREASTAPNVPSRRH